MGLLLILRTWARAGLVSADLSGPGKDQLASLLRTVIRIVEDED